MAVKPPLKPRRERIVSALRTALRADDRQVSDEDLLASTEGALTRQLVEIAIARENLARAAKPVADKFAAVIGRMCAILPNKGRPK